MDAEARDLNESLIAFAFLGRLVLTQRTQIGVGDLRLVNVPDRLRMLRIGGQLADRDPLPQPVEIRPGAMI